MLKVILLAMFTMFWLGFLREEALQNGVALRGVVVCVAAVCMFIATSWRRGALMGKMPFFLRC